MNLWDLVWPENPELPSRGGPSREKDSDGISRYRTPVAFVGGGGKTAALIRLGLEAESRGEAILLTVTTKWGRLGAGSAPRAGCAPADAGSARGAEGPPQAGSAPADAPRAVRLSGAWLPGEGKYSGVDPARIDALAADFHGTVAVEACGSRGLPLKVPGAGEPVIPSSCGVVVCVTGLSALGAPASPEVIHRWDAFAALTGRPVGSPLTPEVLALILAHPDGSFTGAPAGSRLIWLINQADTPARVEKALGFAREVMRLTDGQAGCRIDTIAVASLQSDDPVKAVVKDTPA